MATKETDKILKVLLKQMKAEGIVGTNTVIDGYYMSVEFRREKKKCPKCKRPLDL